LAAVLAQTVRVAAQERLPDALHWQDWLQQGVEVRVLLMQVLQRQTATMLRAQDHLTDRWCDTRRRCQGREGTPGTHAGILRYRP
jgi:hypothetical protein